MRSSGNLIDKTMLKNMNVKGNWQATSKDMVSVLWFLGREGEVRPCTGDGGITRDAETATWFQGNCYSRPSARADEDPGRPRVQLESVHVGEVCLLRHRVRSRPDGRPRHAGRAEPVLNTSFGSTRQILNIRPQHIVNVDTNYFLNALGAAHDFRYGSAGGGPTRSRRTLWPGNMILGREQDATRRGQHRADLPRGRGQRPDRVLGSLCRRHDSKGRHDARSRPALRPAGRQGDAERHAVERRVPRPGARHQLHRLRGAVHLERRVAPRRLHLRARRVEADDPARELQPLRRSARHRHRRLQQPER